MAQGPGRNTAGTGLAKLVCCDVSICRCLCGAGKGHFFRRYKIGNQRKNEDEKIQDNYNSDCIITFSDSNITEYASL